MISASFLTTASLIGSNTLAKVIVSLYSDPSDLLGSSDSVVLSLLPAMF